MPESDDSSSITDDWATRAASSVDSFVKIVRDHSVRPVLYAARVVIVGIILGLVGVVGAALIALGLIRLFDKDVFSQHTWATAFLIGGIFSVAGVFFLYLSGRSRNQDAES